MHDLPRLFRSLRYLSAALLGAALVSACVAEGQTLDGGTTQAANDPIVLDGGDGLLEVEVDRRSDELRDVIRPRPDPDTTDTALVFNNPRRQATWVYCIAYDGNGAPIGRARLLVPGNGVRFVFASDMANGRDFVGSAGCAARSRVVPTAFIAGGGLTDAKASVNHGWDQTRIRFPIVASF